jgi:hypothetical protein
LFPVAVNPATGFFIGNQLVMYCNLKKINIYLKKVIKNYCTNKKVLPLYHQESESNNKQKKRNNEKNIHPAHGRHIGHERTKDRLWSVSIIRRIVT